MAAGAYVVHEGLKHHGQEVAARRADNRERQAARSQHLADMNQQYRQQRTAEMAGSGQGPVVTGQPVPPENRNPMLRQRTARQRLRTDLTGYPGVHDGW